MLITFHSCLCNDGFFGNGTNCFNGTCTDDLCPDNEQCVSASTFDCQCKKGFTRYDAGSCVDEDECSNSEANCNKNADCFNTEGSYTCSCKQGYFGDGMSCLYGQCLDVNCPQNMTCVSPTTSDCKCKSGFTIDPKSENCVDIDECQVDCGTNFDCINTLGSYKCICKTGFYQDGRNCKSLSVLVVGSYRTAVLMNPAGIAKELPCFSKMNLEKACSLSWKNKMHIFGTVKSLTSYTGISRLDGFNINSIGILDFDFYNGACSTMNGQFIFLCFSNGEPHICRRATDPRGDFTDIARPNMNHFDTRTSASRSK